jgi:acyl carrier protein
VTPDFAELSRVLADVFGVDPADIRPDSAPESIEDWDSVQHLNMIIALEQAFDVRFTPEEIEDALTVRAIAGILERKARTG